MTHCVLTCLLLTHVRCMPISLSLRISLLLLADLHSLLRRRNPIRDQLLSAPVLSEMVSRQEVSTLLTTGGYRIDFTISAIPNGQTVTAYCYNSTYARHGQISYDSNCIVIDATTIRFQREAGVDPSDRVHYSLGLWKAVVFTGPIPEVFTTTFEGGTSGTGFQETSSVYTTPGAARRETKISRKQWVRRNATTFVSATQPAPLSPRSITPDS